MASPKNEVLKLFQKHYHTLLLVARNKTSKSSIDADDLMQEFAIKIFRNCEAVLKNYEKKGIKYLLTILNNAFIDLVRKEKRRRGFNLDPDKNKPEQVQIENPQIAKEFISLIQSLVIANFESGSWELFQLYLDGYEYKEIAEILGINKNTVGTRIYRIRKFLRAELDG
ncbi:MAG: sigma-70 family RNA polymerase sigma factor [Saprospiraceae bacterium]|nr:sigma-70 family RNA polymerase sigma factor [Saprospiraceae bacterium]